MVFPRRGDVERALADRRRRDRFASAFYAFAQSKCAAHAMSSTRMSFR